MTSIDPKLQYERPSTSPTPETHEMREIAIRSLELAQPDHVLTTKEVTDKRDALLEMQSEELAHAESSEKGNALAMLQLEISTEISRLTRVEGIHHTKKPVQDLKAVESAYRGRLGNFYSDEIFEQGGPTVHETTDDAFEMLISFTESRLADQDLPTEKVEALRLARNMLHALRVDMQGEYDGQTDMAERVVALVGKDNESFKPANVQASFRKLTGDKLKRARSVIKEAEDTTDSHDKFNLLNDLQHGYIPLRTAEEFNEWREKRKEHKAADEAFKVSQELIAIRGKLSGLHDAKPAPELVETPIAELAAEKPIISVAPQPEKAEVATYKYDGFLLDAIDTVPDEQIQDTLEEIALDLYKHHDAPPNAQQLHQTLKEVIAKGELTIPDDVESKLADRIQANGFMSSNGGIWLETEAPGLIGDAAREAKATLYDLLYQLVR